MARLNWMLWGLWTATTALRSGRGALHLQWVVLVLRTALPIAPNLSDTLATLQGSDHWLHVIATAHV